MKLSDFIMQDGEEKKQIALHQGVLISKRTKPGSFIFLFQMENFYVEMFCDTQTKSVTQFRAFSGTKLLQPYLESITIDGLLKE